jgi:hypothetical protein
LRVHADGFSKESAGRLENGRPDSPTMIKEGKQKFHRPGTHIGVNRCKLVLRSFELHYQIDSPKKET